MRTKLLFTLSLLCFSILSINHCYSQSPISAIGKSADEIAFSAQRGRNQYHVEYYNGKIEYVGVYYPNQLLVGVAWTDMYRYYMMKNGVCDYILIAYNKISMEQLTQYYDTHFLKDGKFYSSKDSYLKDELYEITLFDGKATVKITLQRNSNNENISKPKNGNSQQQNQNTVKRREDAVAAYKDFISKISKMPIDDIIGGYDVVDKGWKAKDIYHKIWFVFVDNIPVKYDFFCTKKYDEWVVPVAVFTVTFNVNFEQELKIMKYSKYESVIEDELYIIKVESEQGI
jgi:hypothetical protein